MASHGWKSERLVYRAAEPEDDTFLDTLNTDFRMFAQAANLIPAPQSKKGGTFLREALEKDLLGVIVCLPAPAATASTSAEDGSAAAAAAPAVAKPIPIGMVGMWCDEYDKMGHHRHAMMGLNIAPAYQNQGYGHEAILWSLRFGFMMINLHHIYLGVFEYNTGAQRLYERVGFKVEGRLREHVWFDGRYWDEINMGMLEHEWKERYGEKSVAVRGDAKA